MMRSPMTCLALFLMLATLAAAPLLAQVGQEKTGAVPPATGGMNLERSQLHGGKSVMTEDGHFEVVWKERFIEVYPYDKEQKPLSAEGMSGNIQLQPRGGVEVKENSLNLEAVKVDDQWILRARTDLSNISPGNLTAQIKLSGLPGTARKPIEFTSSFEGLGTSSTTAPVKESTQPETTKPEAKKIPSGY